MKRKVEIIPLLATFTVGLFSTSSGIIVGIAVHVFMLQGTFRRPWIVTENRVKFISSVSFPAQEAIFDLVEILLEKYEKIIFDFENIHFIDSSMANLIVRILILTKCETKIINLNRTNEKILVKSGMDLSEKDERFKLVP